MQKTITLTTQRLVRLSLRLKIILVALLMLAAVPVLYPIVPAGDDWAEYFRPAALSILHGGSPFVPGFYNAPWVVIPLIPIAVLPFQWGRTIFFVFSLAGFAYLARRMTAKPLSIVLFITSAPVVLCLSGGNLDWIPLLSLVMPAPFALILASIKPQVGAGIALYWLVESWRQGGGRRVLENFLPVTMLLVSSFVFYGLWPLRLGTINNVFWNISPFPYLIPVGIFLVAWAIIRHRPDISMVAGLFFSPYYSIRSLFVFLAPLFEQPRLMFAAWLVLWTGIAILAVIR